MMYNDDFLATKVASAPLYVKLFHLASTHPQSENALMAEWERSRALERAICPK